MHEQGRKNNLPSHTFGMRDVKEEKKGRHGLPKYTLDMEDVKEKGRNMVATSYGTLSVLALLEIPTAGGIFQGSSYLHILDNWLHEGSYSILDGVIYDHGRIFFSKASKLKGKLLQRAYEEFHISHTYSMKLSNIILRSYYWEGFERELYQH